MGIPGFWTYIQSAYPECCENVILDTLALPSNCLNTEHLFLDMNNLLYSLARKSENEEHMYYLLFKQLRQIIKATNPSKTIYFALDGAGNLFDFELSFPFEIYSISSKRTKSKDINPKNKKN